MDFPISLQISLQAPRFTSLAVQHHGRSLSPSSFPRRQCHTKIAQVPTAPVQIEKLGICPLLKGASACHCKVDSLEEKNTNRVINAQKMVAAKA